MKPFLKISGFTLLLITLLFSCQQSSEYHKMVERELASGIRQDSLFLGIYLGMSSKDFYTHCWNLNKTGIIREGTGNTSVNYPIKEFKAPASMDFYPGFYDAKIIEMPVVFTYDGWAPWNKHLSAEPLKAEVLKLMEKWYGTGFLEIENPHSYGGNAFVKVDGNRRISIYNMDDSKVRVDFVDLLMKEKLDKTK